MDGNGPARHGYYHINDRGDEQPRRKESECTKEFVNVCQGKEREPRKFYVGFSLSRVTHKKTLYLMGATNVKLVKGVRKHKAGRLRGVLSEFIEEDISCRLVVEVLEHFHN